MTLWLLTLTTAYLLGSIPFGYLLVRFVRQEDVRDTGSGNIGATNVARAGGTVLGIFTLILDALKGFIAVFLVMQFAPNTAQGPSTLAISAAVAAVVGHVFPIWLRFRGGKGIATALGVFIALAPIIAAASIPFLAILLVPHRSTALLVGLSFISLLSIIKHHANIVRLLKGTESRFGSGKDSDPTDKKVNA
jgi:glycerol-3-phosphate acyltransferase PlsY